MGSGIQEITGYSAEDINPLVWKSMILEMQLPEELAGLTQDEAIQLVREGQLKAWKCDYQIRSRNGQQRWIADRAIETDG